MPKNKFAEFLERKLAFFIFLAIDAICLFLYAPDLGVSAKEARIFFENKEILGYILRFSADIFGQNNFAIRAPFIILHLINLTLVYFVSRDHLTKFDSFLSALLFALLPGINGAALLVSYAPFAILISLIFILLYKRWENIAIAFLFLTAFLDNLFSALILAATIYEIYQKRYRRAVLLSIFIALCYAIHGAEIGGRPRGYFADIFGLYAAIFSPLIYLYFLYSLYWRLFKNEEKLSLIWFIALVPFLLSIVLSLRQNLSIENYAPFAVIATPLMIRSFMSSLRVRLPRFRKKYFVAAGVTFLSLITILLLTFFHKPLYLLMSNSGRHFAREHHFVGDLAALLKSRGIRAAIADRNNLSWRLKFYGIERGGEWKVSEKPENANSKKIQFFVMDSPAITFYLTKKSE
ncbi:MAG: glycosyltransferase family 39 protein [Helicobacteraceae bacterium]|jgi:hypothetical protein|nr:glycosyltransferase family 39 protein [Helicobacteraceae bacterium]